MSAATGISAEHDSQTDARSRAPGDIKKRGKAIKKDHELAMELWSIGGCHARLLATLIVDKKLLTQDVIEKLAADMMDHDENERNQLADWLLANQLMKDKKTVALLVSGERILHRSFVASFGITRHVRGGPAKRLQTTAAHCLMHWNAT